MLKLNDHKKTARKLDYLLADLQDGIQTLLDYIDYLEGGEDIVEKWEADAAYERIRRGLNDLAKIEDHFEK